MVVAVSAATSPAEDILLSRFYQFRDDLFGFGIFYDDALGDFQDNVAPVFPLPEPETAGFAGICPNNFPVAQVDECP